MTFDLHFFTSGDFVVPSSRYRAFLVADRVNALEMGVTAHCHPPLKRTSDALRSVSGTLSELRELRHVRRQFRAVSPDDVIYCERPVNKRLRSLYLLANRRDAFLVFDFDDAVFLQHPDLTRWFLQRADIVIAGNRFLQRYAEWHSDPDRVHLIPTAVPFEHYRQVEYDPQPERLRVGWVGDVDAHRANLESFADVLSEADLPAGFEVHLVGVKDDATIRDRFRGIDGVERAEFTRWIPSDEYAARIPEIINTFDVGVMPLTDTFWNRGKSGLKIIEYFACGVPAVASPVGENEYLISHGDNGYLADDVSEWETAFQRLASSTSRQRLSTCARETVENGYTIQQTTRQRLRIIRERLGRDE